MAQGECSMATGIRGKLSCDEIGIKYEAYNNDKCENGEYFSLFG